MALLVVRATDETIKSELGLSVLTVHEAGGAHTHAGPFVSGAARVPIGTEIDPR